MILLIPMLSTIKVTHAQTVANVSPNPLDITIATVGATETVNITVTDITNLFAYEFKIYYETAVINATNATRPSDQFLAPIIDPGNFFIPQPWRLNNTFNATHGQIWVSYTLLNPEGGKSGNGTLLQITFQGNAIGNTQIIIFNPPAAPYNDPALYPTKLIDPTAVPIVCATAPGNVHVIPEFPIALALPVLAIISLAAALISKRYKRKPI